MLNADTCSQPSCARNCVFPHLPTLVLLRSTGVYSGSQLTEPTNCFSIPQIPTADDNGEQWAPEVRALAENRHWRERPRESGGLSIAYCLLFPLPWLLRHTSALICNPAKEETEALKGKSIHSKSAKSKQKQGGERLPVQLAL